MDAVRGQGPAQTADLARVQSSASSVSPQQQIFTDVTLPVRDRLSTVPQQLPEQHHVAEHVHQRVIVEGMTFSPPEELPSHDHEDARAGHGSSGGQPAWFMRFGEYLQKRATQAGSMMSPLLDPAPRTPTASYPTVYAKNTKPSSTTTFYSCSRTTHETVGETGSPAVWTSQQWKRLISRVAHTGASGCRSPEACSTGDAAAL